MDFGPPAGAFWAPRPTAMKQRRANTGRIRRACINDQPPCRTYKENKKDEVYQGIRLESGKCLLECEMPGSVVRYADPEPDEFEACLLNRPTMPGFGSRIPDHASRLAKDPFRHFHVHPDFLIDELGNHDVA